MIKNLFGSRNSFIPHSRVQSNFLKYSKKSKIFFVIGLKLLIYHGYWYLLIRIDVFLKFNKTDQVEQLGERSASQARANTIFGGTRGIRSFRPMVRSFQSIVRSFHKIVSSSHICYIYFLNEQMWSKSK